MMAAAAISASLLILISLSTVSANWDEWWTYDGISGHKYWGVMNRAWTMCSKGIIGIENRP